MLKSCQSLTSRPFQQQQHSLCSVSGRGSLPNLPDRRCLSHGGASAHRAAPEAPLSRQSRLISCAAGEPERGGSNTQGTPGLLPARFNTAYAAIIGGYAALFALRNPYIFAALSIAAIIPQNSTTTSLNSLVLFFYDTGFFMNFAEAVYCVRLITWLSIVCCLVSFAVFA